MVFIFDTIIIFRGCFLDLMAELTYSLFMINFNAMTVHRYAKRWNKKTKWLVVFFCVVQEIWRTQAAQTFGETTEDGADIVKGQHLMIADDIWYLTNVSHMSEMGKNFRLLSNSAEDIYGKKNVDELKHCPKIHDRTRRFTCRIIFYGY